MCRLLPEEVSAPSVYFWSARTYRRPFPGQEGDLRLRRGPSVLAVPLLQICCDKSIYLEALPFRSSTLDWDRRTSFAWASAGLFLFPFQTTRSENNRFNREAGRAC